MTGPGDAVRQARVYAIDVGAPGGGLAWARATIEAAEPPETSRSIEACATAISADLRCGTPVALGFEAPTFLPVRLSAADLTKARDSESHPWSARAGTTCGVLLPVIAAWILRQVRESLAPTTYPRITSSPTEWEAHAGLLLWEAMVVGSGHARCASAAGLSEHEQDAATAVIAFQHWLSETNPRPASAVTATPRLATLGAAVLWSGWSADLGWLNAPFLVLQPREVHGICATRFAADRDLDAAPK
jgi:hypothetical protein